MSIDILLVIFIIVIAIFTIIIMGLILTDHTDLVLESDFEVTKVERRFNDYRRNVLNPSIYSVYLDDVYIF